MILHILSRLRVLISNEKVKSNEFSSRLLVQYRLAMHWKVLFKLLILKCYHFPGKSGYPLTCYHRKYVCSCFCYLLTQGHCHQGVWFNRGGKMLQCCASSLKEVSGEGGVTPTFFFHLAKKAVSKLPYMG